METTTYKITDVEKDREAIKACGELLAAGGLVGMPTETVYGLAANALDPVAVEAIFTAKGRPQDNPLIVHISDMNMLYDLVNTVPESAVALAGRFWPGPLTMVFPKSEKIPSVVSAGMDSVAIRFPSHPVARALIAAAGVPLAAPSANLSGHPSPTTAKHVEEDLGGRIAAILDAGPCGVGVESTVISLVEERPTLLRPGGITFEQLKEVLPDVQISTGVLNQLPEGAKVRSPGMKYKHYAPKAEVTILDGDREQYAAYVNGEEGAYALCFTEDIPLLKGPYVSYGSEGDSGEQAELLFACLRKLDELGAEKVFAHMPAQTGVGLAVYNRLLRSAAFRVIKL